MCLTIFVILTEHTVSNGSLEDLIFSRIYLRFKTRADSVLENNCECDDERFLSILKMQLIEAMYH